MENVLKRVVMPVEGFCVVRILRDYRSAQVDSREDSAAARPGEKLRVHHQVRRGLSVASDRARCCRRIGTDLKLVVEKVLKTLVIHRYEHQVRGLATGLQSP